MKLWRKPEQNGVRVDRKYSLTVLAENDLKKIWNYTVDKWGEEQAFKYRDKLKHRLQWLADNPFSGSSKDEIKAGYRRWKEGEHLIFYRIADNNTIGIIGIPHQSMDAPQHLSIEENP